MVRALILVAIFLLVIRASFPLNHQNKNKFSDDKTWTMTLGGDVMLGRSVTTESEKRQNATYPFIYIADFFKDSDIAIVNLENPVIENCPRRIDGMIFCSPPTMLSGLTLAGIDVVNLANNHTLNYGQSGLDETKKYLNGIDISFSVSSDLLIREIQGTKVGFLGFDKSQVQNPTLTSGEIKLIEESNNIVDVLVVSMHWGVEYKSSPLPGVEKLAKDLISHGADLIIGHHPHWVQGSEQVEGKYIYYSLGNLVFDQMWSEETRKGKIVRLTFKGDKIIDEDIFETYMESWAQPMIIPSPNE